MLPGLGLGDVCAVAPLKSELEVEEAEEVWG